MDGLTGTVKFFNTDKGYGFINAEDGNEYFFHVSGVEQSAGEPKKGDRVRFQLQTGKRGLKAIEIRIL